MSRMTRYDWLCIGMDAKSTSRKRKQLSHGTSSTPFSSALRRLHCEKLEDRRLLAFDPTAPLGGLVYSDVISDSISTPGEFDIHNVELDAGQTISLEVLPDTGVSLSAVLIDPNGFTVDFLPAVTPGLRTVSQTAPVLVSGTYMIGALGVSGTVGDYEINVVLNSAIEAEYNGLDPNDTYLTSQSIEGSFFTDLGVGGAERGAVIGNTDFVGPTEEDWYSFQLSDGESASIVLANSGATVDLYDSDGTTLLTSGQDNGGLQEIRNFVDPTTDGSLTTYFAKVTTAGTDYSLVVTRGADFDNDANNSLATAQNLASTDSALGHLSTGGNEDFYKFDATSGDGLTIETSVPAAGPSEFVNDLDLGVELINPSGSVVASGTVGTLSHTAAATGEYAVRLFSQGGTEGEYALSVSGNSFTPTPFTVDDSTPGAGDTFSPTTTPTQMTIEVSEPLLLSTIDASDLTINGVEATAVSWTDPLTLVFDLPALAGTTQTALIAEGALTSLSSKPLVEFSAVFTLDGDGPRVIDSSIQDGEIIPTGPLTYTVQFDEPLLETSLDSSDIRLIDGGGPVVSPTSFSYDSGTSILTVEFPALSEGSYTIELLSGDGQLEDLSGNDLDGEVITSPIGPNVSGDGVAGGDFVISFSINDPPTPIPTPLQPVSPLGSLLYEGGITGDIGPANTDTFLVDLDEDQTATLVVTGSNGLTPSITVLYPGLPLTITETAPGPNGSAVLQSLSTVSSGTYTIEITAADGTSGDYSLELLLNGVVEDENFDGSDNDSLATAQSLDAAFIDRGTLGSEAAAVVGVGDGTGVFSSEDQTQSDNVFAPNVLTFDFVGSPAPVGDGVLTVTTISDLDSSTEFLTFNFDGEFSQNLFVTGGLQQSLISTTVNLTQAQLAAMLADDGDITITVTPSSAVNDLGPNFLTLELSYATAPPTSDYYSFTLEAGQSASLALSGDSSVATLELLDGGGNLLTTGVAATNVDQIINNFVSGSGGTYYANVTSGDSDYSLVVTRNADFDSEGNGGSGAAQDISGTLGVIGHIKGEATEELPEGAFLTEVVLPESTSILFPETNVPPQSSISIPYTSDLTFKESMALLDSGGVVQGPSDATLTESEFADLPATVQSALGETLSGPIPVLNSFPGPASNGFIPPDPTAAAGPEQIVAMVNTQIAIYDKETGAELFQQLLNGPTGFFGSTGATTVVFDPWVLYDAETERFFAIAIDIATSVESNVFLAVSTDSTPTSGDDWHKYKIDFSHDPAGTGLGTGIHFPDYPKLGVSDDAIWISGNYFPINSGTGVYAGITAIAKDPLLSGGTADILYEEHFSGFSVMPMTQYESPETQYFAETSTGGGSSVTIHAVSDVLTSPTRTTSTVSVPSFAFPPDVPQMGGGTPADSIDARVMTGVWRNGSMWFAHAISDPAVGDGETVVRWYEVATNDFGDGGGSPTLVQSGNVDPGPGIHTWMPAVAVDSVGDLAIGFSVGGPSQFLGAGFTGRLANDPLGTVVLPINEYVVGLGNYQAIDGSGRNRWGDYTAMAIDPTSDGTFWVFNEYATSTNSWATEVASFQLREPVDEDWYEFTVNPGDILRIETFTPASGPFEFVNELDPSLELYDTFGNLVATSNSEGNEVLFHVVGGGETGKYQLRLFSEDGSAGEYFVQVEGSSASSLLPTVIDTNPDFNATVPVFPTTYTLEFSEQLLLPSVEASDLLIGGLPALSVNGFGSTYEFEVDPAANVGDGLYLVELTAGSVLDLQGQGNDLFTTTFTYDTSGPVIVDTFWNGDPLRLSKVYEEGPLIFEAVFNEDLFVLGSARRGPFAPGPDDIFVVDDQSGEVITPLEVNYDTSTDTVQVIFDYLPEADYTLTINSGNGAIEDIVGNDLDGEPLGPQLDGTVTGDGVNGGNYSVQFSVDSVSRDLMPFVRTGIDGSLVASSRGVSQAPAITSETEPNDDGVVGASTGDLPLADDLSGSFVPLGGDLYQAIVNGTISAGSNVDWDFFKILAAPGDTLEATLRGLPSNSGTLGDPYLWLYDNQANLLAANDDFFGLESFIGYSNFSYSGDYYVVADSFSSSVGTYELTVDLTTANPQIGAGLGNRGTINLPGDQDVFNFFVEAGQTLSAVLTPDNPLATLSLELLGVGTPVVASAPGESAVLSPVPLPFDATYQLRVSGDVPGAYSLDAFLNASLEAQVADTDFVSRLAIDDSFVDLGSGRYAAIGEFSLGDSDFFTVDLSAKVGETIDVLLGGLLGGDASQVSLLLFDDADNVLALGSDNPLGGPAVSNYDVGILNFQVPDIGTNVYTISLSTSRGGIVTPFDYSIVVTDSLVFDTEPNDAPQPVFRDLNDVPTALGYLSDANPAGLSDSYEIDLLTGQTLRLYTDTLFDHPLSTPLNDLDPSIAVFDPGGGLVVSDSNSLDGKNAEIEFTATQSGTYRLEISAEQGSGTYLLTSEQVALSLSADFDEDNDTDGFDFLAWQRGAGKPSANVTKSDGDADGDNDVDGDDLSIWTSDYGVSVAATASAVVEESGAETSESIEPNAAVVAQASSNRNLAADGVLQPPFLGPAWSIEPSTVDSEPLAGPVAESNSNQETNRSLSRLGPFVSLVLSTDANVSVSPLSEDLINDQALTLYTPEMFSSSNLIAEAGIQSDTDAFDSLQTDRGYYEDLDTSAERDSWEDALDEIFANSFS